MTPVRTVTPDFSVSAQVDPDDLQSIADVGFRSIISNRPDDEDPGQPDWREIEAAAKAAGLEARHIPVIPGAIGVDDVANFAAALDEMPRPILAFCRSGTRAASLWGLAQAGHRSPDEIIAAAANAGCDLSALRPRLG
jgi:uncharacterized protein (TIGR01244 family)